MSAVRVGVEALHYTWENTGQAGYHINGRISTDSVLEKKIIPSFGQLPIAAVVADFGCGNGRLVRQARGGHFIVRGYEINPTAVSRFNTEFAHTLHWAEVADLTQLDLGITGVDRFHAALLWRVLHAIDKDSHQAVLRGITRTLRPGASLHIAARSARDWVAADLRDKGLYRPGEMNDCYRAMAEALDQQGLKSWHLFFFRKGELARLGEQAGLIVVHQQPIQEPSGYQILRETRPPLSYDYVEFVKP